MQSHVRGNVAVYVEALVVMSTRFLKDHIEMKWWTDGYYHHRALIHTLGTWTQSWSQFSRSLYIWSKRTSRLTGTNGYRMSVLYKELFTKKI